MIQTLTKNWYLLALCGVFAAVSSVIYFMMYEADPDAASFRGWHAEGLLVSKLSLAAGVCAIAAGLWRRPLTGGIAWLLVLNGLAFGAYGLIPLVESRGPLSFRLFAFLVVVMAMSFGALAWGVARTLWHDQGQGMDKWIFRLAGVVSMGFALAFLALMNGWIQLERRPFHPPFFVWIGLYFGFNAIGMLGLALRLRSLGTPGPASRSGLLPPPLVSPKHAH